LIYPGASDSAPYHNHGSPSTTTITLSAANYGHHKVQAAGARTISFTWAGTSGETEFLFLEAVDFGAYTITWPSGTRWIKSDGTYTTTFSSNGVTLQSSGTDFCMFWRSPDGYIYGKWLR
jgi:hypothetical protein